MRDGVEIRADEMKFVVMEYLGQGIQNQMDSNEPQQYLLHSPAKNLEDRYHADLFCSFVSNHGSLVSNLESPERVEPSCVLHT